MRTWRAGRASAVLAAAALLAAGCGGDGGGDGGDGGKPKEPAKGAEEAPAEVPETIKLPKLDGTKLTVAAIWTGAEQKNFMKVAEEFEKRTGAEITFTPTGDNVSTFLGSKVAGKQPPDVAFLPQVGVLKQFADKGWVKEASPLVAEQLQKNYSAGWTDLGKVDGKQYGVYFKVANKSTVWYNTTVLEEAGVTPPKTWDEFMKAATTVYESGTPAVSVAGADGWTLTDWFENVYLSQAGREKYDQLAQRKIPYTDPSVKDALTTLGELFSKDDLIAGGRKGALQTDFPTSVINTFAAKPKAGMVYEGDFVTINIASDTKAKVGEDAKFFPFPAVGDGESPLVVGGDVGVVMKESEAAQALLAFTASPEASAIWAKGGGFFTANKNMDSSAYPNDTAKGIGEAIIAAGDNLGFDMSDQAPAAFGGTKGSGEWKILQDFLKDPSDVAGTQKTLEAEAEKAWANAG